jgi:hypothetical protein
MRSWHEASYFHGGVLVRAGYEANPFLPLALAFPVAGTEFLVPPLPPLPWQPPPFPFWPPPHAAAARR